MDKTEGTTPKIMTKPLPQILDELEDYIARVEEAVKEAKAAAEESKGAAVEAKAAGAEAAAAAREAAEAAVAEVREEANKKAEALAREYAELLGKLDGLAAKVKQEAVSLDAAFLALKAKHVEQSPFFQH